MMMMMMKTTTPNKEKGFERARERRKKYKYSLLPRQPSSFKLLTMKTIVLNSTPQIQFPTTASMLDEPLFPSSSQSRKVPLRFLGQQRGRVRFVKLRQADNAPVKKVLELDNTDTVSELKKGYETLIDQKRKADQVGQVANDKAFTQAAKSYLEKKPGPDLPTLRPPSPTTGPSIAPTADTASVAAAATESRSSPTGQAGPHTLPTPLPPSMYKKRMPPKVAPGQKKRSSSVKTKSRIKAKAAKKTSKGYKRPLFHSFHISSSKTSKP